MKVSFKNKPELVAYVNDRLNRSRPDCVLTMTIVQEKSEGSYVLIVTEELWGDTVKNRVLNYSELLTYTSQKNTPAG